MLLRDHPLMTYKGVPSWPPAWLRRVGCYENTHPTGEIGILKGVAPSRFPQDLPGAGVEGSIKRERAVAKVFKTVSFGSSGRERQDWILAVQCLNGRFLIHRENCRVLGRIQIKSNDSRRFTLKIRIVAGHVALKTMWLDTVLGPHSCNGRMRNITQFQREFATAPVSRAIGWLSLCRPFKNTRRLPFAARVRCLSTVAGGPSRPTLSPQYAPPPAT